MTWTPPRRRAIVEPLSRKRQRHRQATLLVTDDYGDAVGHLRRCSTCRTFKPLDLDHFGATGRDERALGYQRICRDCERAAQARRRNVNRAAYNQQARDAYHRRMRDPARREAVRERERAYRQRRLQQDPERVRSQARERSRRYLKRIMNDPVRHAERIDKARIDRVLRGHKPARPIVIGRSRGVLLPVQPLYERVVLPRLAIYLRQAIGSIARDKTPRLTALPDMTDRSAVQRTIEIAAALGFPSVGPLADELGVSARTINAWVRGERPTLRSSLVEEILVRVGMFWWEVYEPGDDGYEQARAVFEGDEAIAA